METKTLYIIFATSCDGSKYARYTTDYQVIEYLEKSLDNGTIDDDFLSGDGISYDSIEIPVNFYGDELGIQLTQIEDLIL